jgi:L-threonylcarbamoyladenylate synthase
VIVLSEENRAAAIAEAVAVMKRGELVALPTETVYGLSADAGNGMAVARIFAAKGRPRFNPLICHVTGVEMARRYGRFSARAALLAEKFWPGPLTVAIPLLDQALVSPLATAGLPTIALRAPRGIAHEIIASFGSALAAPSANASGRLSPTRAEHVIESLGEKVALVLDAGPCEIGLESTIVSLAGDAPVLLRPGGVPAEAIEKVLETRLVRAGAGDPVTAPGMLQSHYAPRLPLRLDATYVAPEEALLAFGPASVAGSEGAASVRNLSPRGDLVEAAANLFSHLAELDSSSASGIAVAPIPAHGLGEAINDRLIRAAAPRRD